MSTRGEFLAGAIAALTPVNPIAPPLPTITATIGVAGPFTGKDQALGQQLGNGVQQAIYEANQLRGSFDGLMSMRTFDDQNLLAQATVTAQFAIDDPSVLCMIGHLSGHATEAALQTYANAKLALIIPASSYEKLTSYGYGGVLRIPTKDSTEGQLGASYVLDTMKPKRVTTLSQTGDYGADVARGFTQQIQGAKIPCASVSFSWEKPNFTDAAQQALSSNPDLIYLAGSANDMGPVVTALRGAKYSGRFAASQGFFSPFTTDTYANDLEGLVVSSSIPPFQLAPGNLRIIQDFQQNYGQFTPLSALGYAAAQIAIATIRRTGSSNRLSVWRNVQNPTSYDTVVGSFSFLSSGDQVEPNVYFYQIKGGKWEYLKAAHTTS